MGADELVAQGLGKGMFAGLGHHLDHSPSQSAPLHAGRYETDKALVAEDLGTGKDHQPGADVLGRIQCHIRRRGSVHEIGQRAGDDAKARIVHQLDRGFIITDAQLRHRGRRLGGDTAGR